ncbi:IS66 family insertion sequence element accessory protein TnpA [Rhodoferax antarcticus]|uniref:IS66 family insertion sequence element accessory protein TnpA n=1 Tax=Rhodoferax antarcticus TaxID=81479 RepID=UPI00222425E6|nr:transposase [Rhodoferax antarcticus]MCW2313022.1 transposase-like protein [Rhodoferax antarcticus]
MRHLNSDGKTDTQARSTSFAQHVEAAWRAGLSIAVYAKTHGLAASTLYRWQQKLRQTKATAIDAIALTPSPAKPEALEPTEPEPAQGKFIDTFR